MTNTRPTYCIVETVPNYCQFTDALKGSRSRVVEYAETESWAHFRAGELTIDAGQGSDASYHAARTDAPCRPLFQFQPRTTFGIDDEIPF